MDHLAATLSAAVVLFAGTNVDDLIVLTVLFLGSRTAGRPRPWEIWVGQYAGIAALVAASALVAAGLAVVPDRWVGLLGLIPLLLGVRALIRALRARADGAAPPAVATSALAVAGVTVANGADNIAVYTPVFRTIGLTDSLLTVAVFAVLVALWCVAASRLGSHPRVVTVIERCGHWLVPAVFILIGLAILTGLA
ncbi:cadmium resistance transporter [Catellatospora sichuanensis]|uniref:cadmium resistance transporter n=1 Tax=Catellatospora sichuanensis TaxID=1969805 RepID=UPI001C9234B1|nr:cadmium resistance transporter [Catellatospora sichuanensis]